MSGYKAAATASRDESRVRDSAQASSLESQGVVTGEGAGVGPQSAAAQAATAFKKYLHITPSCRYEPHGRAYVCDAFTRAREQGIKISLNMPAFPFKVPREKTLAEVSGQGPALVDAGEHASLTHLAKLQKELAQHNPVGGVEVRIYCDTEVFTGLLEISVLDAGAYRAGMRRICEGSNVAFISLADIYPDIHRDDHAALRARMLEEVAASKKTTVAGITASEIEESEAGVAQYIMELLVEIHTKRLIAEGLDPVVAAERAEGRATAGVMEFLTLNRAYGELIRIHLARYQNELGIRISCHAQTNANKFGVSMFPWAPRTPEQSTPWQTVPVLVNETVIPMRREQALRLGCQLYEDRKGYLAMVPPQGITRHTAEDLAEAAAHKSALEAVLAEEGLTMQALGFPDLAEIDRCPPSRIHSIYGDLIHLESLKNAMQNAREGGRVAPSGEAKRAWGTLLPLIHPALFDVETIHADSVREQVLMLRDTPISATESSRMKVLEAVRNYINARERANQSDAVPVILRIGKEGHKQDQVVTYVGHAAAAQHARLAPVEMAPVPLCVVSTEWVRRSSLVPTLPASRNGWRPAIVIEDSVAALSLDKSKHEGEDKHEYAARMKAMSDVQLAARDEVRLALIALDDGHALT